MTESCKALLANNLWLAPMAGVADPIFRRLCLQQGAGLTYTEMISAKGLHYRNERTEDLLLTAPGEKRCAVQLFGNDETIMAEEAARIESDWGTRLAFIDINMGCPVPKVTRKGEGAALMREPKRAAAIVSAIRNAVEVPLGAKFRAGWNDEDRCAPIFAKYLEQAGADIVCVHGRSATQGYSGRSDSSVISETVCAVSIPVLASGDVMSHKGALDLLDETGAAGVLIARGACGNPWVFNGHESSAVERVDMALRHAKGLCEMDPIMGIRRMRKHMAYYLNGFPHAAEVRRQAINCDDFAEFQTLCEFTRERIEDTEETGACKR